MNGYHLEPSGRHTARGALRAAAGAAILALFVASLPSTPAHAASQVVVQRIKGSVAAGRAGSSGGQITTSAGIPENANLATSCESLAAITYPAGSIFKLGGSSRASVPGAMDVLQLDGGAVAYEAHPGAGPFMVKTKAGSIAIPGGSGFIISGKKGVQLIATSGSPVFTTPAGTYTVNAGQMFLAPIDGGAAAQASPAVGNPALNQFDLDHPPAGSGSKPAFDPTGSVNPTCATIVPELVAGGAAAALLTLLNNKPKNPPLPPGTTPTPTATGTPTTGTPTPVGTGSPVATATPTGATPTPTATGTIAPLTLNPSAVLLAPAVGSPAAAVITATQGSYTGPFTAALNCPVNVGLTVSVSGNQITVQAPGTVAAGLLCSVVVTGQGGMMATASVTVTVGLLGGSPSPAATATPVGATPTPAGTVAPLTLNPTSVLLAPAVGQPVAASITATQGSYTGPFTATISCPVNLGVTVSVNGNQIIVQAPGTIAAGVLCTVTVTGQGGMTAQASVTVGLGVIGGTPTPSPTASGATPAPSGSFGPLVFNPTTILLAPAVGSSAAGSFTVTQAGYTGPFSATVACAVNEGVTVSVAGNTVTVSTPNTLAVGVLCSVTVTGGGGATGQVPVTITLGVLGGNGASTARSTGSFGMSTRSITLANRQPATLDLHGAGAPPFRLDGCSNQLTSLSVNGLTASFVALNPGNCTLNVRSADGIVTALPVVVRVPLDRTRVNGNGPPQLR